jgi:hypothetical protein
MDTKKYLLYGGVSVVILAIGIAIGSFSINKGGSNPAGSANTFQAGWDAAKKRLADTGYAFPTMAEMVSVAGITESVSDNGMIVKIRPLEPLADPALDTRTVQFDANTKFYQIEQKDPIEYQKEVNAFNLKLKANPTALATIPGGTLQPFTKTTVTAKAIKTGMTVSITAASNIKEAKEFVAKEVTVQIVAAATVPAVVPPAPTVAPR